MLILILKIYCTIALVVLAILFGLFIHQKDKGLRDEGIVYALVILLISTTVWPWIIYKMVRDKMMK